MNYGSSVRHPAVQSPYRLSYPSSKLPQQRRRNFILSKNIFMYANMNCHSPGNRRPALCSGDPSFDTDVKIHVMVDGVLINYLVPFFGFSQNLVNVSIHGPLLEMRLIESRLMALHIFNGAHILITYQNTNLTFRVPCIVIYSYNKSQRDALFLKFSLIKYSTFLGQIYCPSSGVSTL